MPDADLETRYRAYLDALNERRLDDLVHYVQDELTYNGEAMTRRRYQDMLAGDFDAIPDLFFDAHTIVASGDQVACRLVFDCTPGTISSASHRTANDSVSRSMSSTSSARAASRRYRP